MPTAPAIACRCGQLNCQQHTRKTSLRHHDQVRGNSSARGYGYNWTKRLRPMVLARDPLCKDPFRSGCNAPSTVADHIIPKQAGGPDAMENLQGLCNDCHNRKIAVEQASSFRRGCACDIHTQATITPGRATVTTYCAGHAPSQAMQLAGWSLEVSLNTGVGGVCFLQSHF